MIEILKETARYLVCVKPIGIAAQGTQAEAMPQLLSEQLGCDIFPVHRLDQTVGGIMVYAKTVQEAARLTQAMGQGQMQKTYLAVLTGCPAEKAGTLEDLLFHDRVKNKTYVVKRMRGGVKQAKLHYEILARQDGLSLVRIPARNGAHAPDPRPVCLAGSAAVGRRKIRQPLWPLHLCALVLPAFLPGRKGRSRLRGPAPGPVPVDGVFLIRCTVQSFRQIRTVFSRLTARTSRRAAA